MRHVLQMSVSSVVNRPVMGLGPQADIRRDNRQMDGRAVVKQHDRHIIRLQKKGDAIVHGQKETRMHGDRETKTETAQRKSGATLISAFTFT